MSTKTYPFRAAPGHWTSLVHRVGWDAGDRSCRDAGRTKWAQEDYDAAVEQMNRLMDAWAAGEDPEIEEVAA
ncbi:hypothetical protein [uncultured Piscinibacter sp.]|uniref:hypothetical protein n=1 Tax=uncultured Piscinibacter sp. TaxID=1131835 RepID=UPI002620ACC8|nr:hypothetical protein [uncultured Piscinibacter sp.]